ncbi:uncharacterized protein YukE [Kitasatospora sp. MAA4]|uniref:hypothetical protein n=1 Tax=Kitasatospora sp. MAA4 TaxID=3035093 RepID=UPI0024745FEA|nr:hypothetical protein [Kitasatospora sp. MAA4]MDH6133263.1 uncharacterized protein YukE [Kitasatospora sp. MAA4]
MSTPVLNKDDAAIQQALMGLDTKISEMMTSALTVERINAEINAGYISGASTKFQQNIEDWISRYKTVMNAFQKLSESTAGANQVLNKAEDEAGLIGGNWGASDPVFQALSGS